ncbi:MAG TPA: SpoIID/LytB domain-containing protein [Mycobacteriales bacterium]|nr:SpoIID/LytB domain-containing protein [Mycobacteriales bacterium]
MTHVTQRTATLTTWAVAACATLVGVLLAAPVGGASPRAVHEVYGVPAGGSFTISGHGYGHGHGLSQWGAYGAAKVADLSSNQILHFYYPHTTLATKPVTQTVRVLLTATAAPSKKYVEFNPAPGLAVTPAPSTPSTPSEKRRRAADEGSTVLPETADGGATIDHWRLRKQAGTIALQGHWSGAWHTQTADVGSSATVSDTDALIAVVEPNGAKKKTIRYRGQIVAQLVSGSMQAVDNVLVESYLRSVVPSEMSSSWPAAALQAQAVAARTYTWRAIGSPKAPWYDLVGDTRDQAYGGFGAETKKTDNAVHSTAGEIAVDGGGAPIFAQYSASDGGWTVSGGQAYLPAKRDPYDGKVPNNGHSWSTSITTAAIEAAYPSIGDLQQLVITGRDGHGAWGGRVTTMSIVGSKGTASPSGAAFQSAFGLRSTWFRPQPPPGPPTKLTVEVTGHTVVVTWQPPAAADGAADVTGYKVTLSPGGHTTTVDATTTTATFTAVRAGSYTAEVVAKSPVGTSAPATAPVTVKKLL